jgi:hypothetical protein
MIDLKSDLVSHPATRSTEGVSANVGLVYEFSRFPVNWMKLQFTEELLPEEVVEKVPGKN